MQNSRLIIVAVPNSACIKSYCRNSFWVKSINRDPNILQNPISNMPVTAVKWDRVVTRGIETSEVPFCRSVDVWIVTEPCNSSLFHVVCQGQYWIKSAMFSSFPFLSTKSGITGAPLRSLSSPTPPPPSPVCLLLSLGLYFPQKCSVIRCGNLGQFMAIKDHRKLSLETRGGTNRGSCRHGQIIVVGATGLEPAQWRPVRSSFSSLRHDW